MTGIKVGVYHYKAVVSCNGELLSPKPEWIVIRSDGPDHAEGLRGIARQLENQAKGDDRSKNDLKGK